MNDKEIPVALTGDRPTGPLHLGHYVGSLRSRLQLEQEARQYIMIADMQALTDNFKTPSKVRDNVLEVACDYLAVGLDPEKSTIFIQSQIPELTELTMYYLNLVTVARLERNPTVKEEIKQKEFGRSVPVGFFCYPISQAADITAFRASIVPVGDDQLPMIELTNEIVNSFNRIYKCKVLVRAKARLSKISRLPGTDGQAKMGKSLGNAIMLCDPEKVVAKKVKRMYTDPNHLRVEDPGTVEGNPVFSYLDAFDPDKEALEEMKAHYRRGGLGDVKVKNRLREVLEAELRPIRERREQFASDEGEIVRILQKGTEKAREVCAETLSMVRRAVKVDHFSVLEGPWPV